MTGRGVRTGLAAAAAGALVAAALATAATAAKPRRPEPRTVRVYDNSYDPAKLRIRSGTKVTWRWPDDVGDTHDVVTRSVPKGAKRFRSPPYAVGATWSRTFKRPGRYRLYCSFHATEMRMTIVVTKRPGARG